MSSKDLELEQIRRRLEHVAKDHADNCGGSWDWDSTKMHLTMWNPDSSPFAILHVKYKQ